MEDQGLLRAATRISGDILGDTTDCYHQALLLEPSSSSASAASGSCSIHKVPDNWRQLHETAFTPNVVSIGLLNYGSKNYHQLLRKELKLRFLNDLLVGVDTESSTIKLALEMLKLDVDIRRHYPDNLPDFPSEEVASVMILDGCFLIQLFRLFAKSHKVADDPVFSTRWLLPKLRRDVLLVENQIPWIVLEKVFQISGLEKEGRSLIDLALTFCNPLLPRDNNKEFLDKYIKSNPKPPHLLGLFHASFIPHHHEKADNKLSTTSFCTSPFLSHFKKNKELAAGRKVDEEQPPPPLEVELISEESERRRQKQHFEEEDEPEFIQCVTQLQDSGVKFKKRKNHDLLDIAFKNGGVLEIPPLLINHNTALVFLNFCVYEHCTESLKPYFTDYVSFIDNLVDSAKDVEILHYKGIINHSLGSDEEVAELFNRLCTEMVYEVDNTNYYYEVRMAINKHCAAHWNSWKAELKHVYFRSPWTVFSIIAAVFLLILTIVQTIFTIIPFFKE